MSENEVIQHTTDSSPPPMPHTKQITDQSSEIEEQGQGQLEETEEQLADETAQSDKEAKVLDLEDDQSSATRKKLRRSDSLDIESQSIHSHHSSKASTEWLVILQLAFQSIGIVYGDIGTSPLYVYSSTFPSGIKHNDDILGVLSLIFYTITLIPLIKYVFIVLQANDNGDGGTFALYSLICRYAKVGLTPSEQAEDKEVSNFRIELPSKCLKMASKLKSKLEKSNSSKYILLLATMLGTSMVIGDGILTPCISVLSAVGGLKEATSSMTQDKIVWTSVAILVALFMFQRLGTSKISYTFAPIICVWFALIAGIGIYNFVNFDPLVVKAINPKYIVDYFQRNKKDAWISLGGIVLAVTGTEALFADVGHFTVRSVQISMCAITYPALITAYIGQASFLRKHNDCVSDTFYKSIPKSFYWPMFVVAVAAAIIASQAMISGTFSIIQQSLALGCFPHVKIVHTSTKYKGQVYIPEVNYFLMIACVAVTLGFKSTVKIGNAYGIAVVFVMTLTSAFMVIIMIMIWKSHIVLVITYVLIIGTVELVYLSSVLYKFDQGGYLPLTFAMILMAVMFTWNDVYRRKYNYELRHKISPESLREVTSDTKFRQLSGLALFYSELVHGVPPIFAHYAANVPALHTVLVFVSIRSLPISKVPRKERFLFHQVGTEGANAGEPRVYCCVARYGYTDTRSTAEDGLSFEDSLVESLKDFVRTDNNDHQEEDIIIEAARLGGVVHLIGENEVVAAKDAGFFKRVLINCVYSFMKKNLRQTDKVFEIPHERMLKVGMTYHL